MYIFINPDRTQNVCKKAAFFNTNYEVSRLQGLFGRKEVDLFQFRGGSLCLKVIPRLTFSLRVERTSLGVTLLTANITDSTVAAMSWEVKGP